MQLTLYHRSSDITYHHDDLVGDVPPSPNAFVMGVIRLDERVVAHSQEFEVPLVLRGPSRQRLHLDEDHALVPGGEAGDDRLVEVDVLGDVVRGGLPHAVAVAEVDAERAPIGEGQRGGDV